MKKMKRLVAVNWNDPLIDYTGKSLNQIADDIIDILPKKPSDEEIKEAISDELDKEADSAQRKIDDFNNDWKANEQALKEDLDEYYE
jgi:hypothetical protein